MPTVVTYGNVQIYNVLTENFSQEPIYDPSDTDLLYHRFTITISGMCGGATPGTGLTDGHPTVVGMTYGSSMYLNGIVTFQTIQQSLARPRQPFAMRIDGQDLFKDWDTSDSNNGPKVRNISIMNIAHSTFRVQCTFELCKTICFGDSSANPLTNTAFAGDQSSNVLSNRWDLLSDYDDEWRETRIVRGQLRLKQSLQTFSNAGTVITPNAFRYLVTPALQQGFDRVGMRFNTTADNLLLEYEFRDRQRFAAPPIPAVKWACFHGISVGESAVQATASLDVTLTGPPTVNKAYLTGTAVLIAFTKLRISEQTSSTSIRLLKLQLVDHMHSGTIELHMVVQDASGETLAFFSANYETFGKTLDQSGSPGIPGYDPNASPVPPPYGFNELIGAFSSYLQSPCAPNPEHAYPQLAFPPTEEGSTPSRGNTPPKQYEVTSSAVPTKNPLISAAAQASGAYSSYYIDSSYEERPVNVNLPVAGARRDNVPTMLTIPLAASSMRRVIKVEARRQGEWPVLPEPLPTYQEAGGIVATLIKSVTQLGAPEVGANGSVPDYTSRMEIVYQLSGTVPKESPLQSALLPWSSGAYDKTLFNQTTGYSPTIAVQAQEGSE